MDINEIVNDIQKWLFQKKTMIGIVGVIVIVLVLYADFSYWAGVIEVGATPNDDPIIDDNATVIVNYTYMTERALESSGSTGRPSPFMQSSYVDETFEVREYAHTCWINLTHEGGGVRSDYDLYILGPDGDEIGSSASENADESAKLDEKALKRAGPGTYTAHIVVYTGVAMSYSITADVMYAIPENDTCPPGEICPA